MIGRQVIESRSDAAQALEAAEHPLDGVAPAIGNEREAWLPATIDLGWDTGRSLRLRNRLRNGVGIVAFIYRRDAAGGQTLHQMPGPNTQIRNISLAARAIDTDLARAAFHDPVRTAPG